MSKLVDFPTSLPAIPIPENTNAAEVVASFVSRLEHLKKSDFKDDAVWRDTFALAGTSRTFYGPSSITAAWHETTKRSKAGLFSLNEKTARIIRSPLGPHWIQGELLWVAKVHHGWPLLTVELGRARRHSHHRGQVHSATVAKFD